MADEQQLPDEKFMRRCLQLAACGKRGARPNPMVGAVIVTGAPRREIIGEGYHARSGGPHAEVNAFSSVSGADESLLTGATLYVSLEPCSHWGKTPPCVDLIIRKGIRRVVAGVIDPFAEVSGRGIRKLRAYGVNVAVGALEKECRWLNRRFFTFHERHRPYIILKWAESADGFLDNRFSPAVFSTPYTLMLSHKMRSEEDAVLVGRVTKERDHPLLTVRHWKGADPERLVLSHPLSPSSLLDRLWREKKQSLIVEGGAATHRSFLDRGLWDEIRVETAPVTVGDGTRAATLPPGLRLMSSEEYDGNIIRRYIRD